MGKLPFIKIILELNNLKTEVRGKAVATCDARVGD
jgi:hypothetical protein